MLPDTLVGTKVPNLIFRRTESHALKSQSGLKISHSNWKDLEEVVVSDAGSLGHVDPCSLQLELRLDHQVRLRKKKWGCIDAVRPSTSNFRR